MTLPSLAASTVAALLALQPRAELPPKPFALSCELQPGADWNVGEGDVSAVVCEGVKGFFVPSPKFREMSDPTRSEPYKLLERELKLSTDEGDELRKAAADGKSAVDVWKGLAREYRTDWIEESHRADEWQRKAAEAARRDWWESQPLWYALGALTVVGVEVAVAVGR